jgi:hypothetical protein
MAMKIVREWGVLQMPPPIAKEVIKKANHEFLGHG